MLEVDRIKIIQDLQCKHAKGLAAFDTSLSFGLCVEEKIKANIQINYLVDTLYRYTPFTTTVTNADMITIDIANTDPLEVYEITVAYGTTTLASFVGTGTQESVVDQLVTLINDGTLTHNYYCVSDGNTLYLYTYDVGSTYADTLTLTYSEANSITTELSMTATALDETQLYRILDILNCLSLEEVCAIVTEIRRLLGLCGC
jgi:hypothetical protein